jgi:hypothetical protein
VKTAGQSLQMIRHMPAPPALPSMMSTPWPSHLAHAQMPEFAMENLQLSTGHLPVNEMSLDWALGR